MTIEEYAEAIRKGDEPLAVLRAFRGDVAHQIMHEMNNEMPDYIRYGNVVAILSGGEAAPYDPRLSVVQRDAD